MGHSVSPVIHRAAYEQLTIDAEYSTVDCPEQRDVVRQFDALVQGRVHGANVTVPWKQVAFEMADHIDMTAERVGVANVLSRGDDGRVTAYNTDASALSDELKLGLKQIDRGEGGAISAVVLGNGGAARAAVVACQLAGIQNVFVTARRFSSNVPISSWPAADGFHALGAELIPWPEPSNRRLAEVFQEARLLVQATSAGMKGTDGGSQFVDVLPWEKFQLGVVYDLVYNPVITPFLKRARGLGHVAIGGLGMLVGQARDAIQIWTGEKPDQEPMMKAARQALGL